MFQHEPLVDVIEFSDCETVNLDILVTSVVKLLRRNGLTVAVAESCTGGLISAYLTSVGGASAVYLGGICAYADSMKESLLGVPHETIAAHGAVSRQTAGAMCLGLSDRTGADVCIAVTGIAGPGGGTPDKPVGTAYVGMLCCSTPYLYHLQLADVPGLNRDLYRRIIAAFVFQKLAHLLMEEDS